MNSDPCNHKSIDEIREIIREVADANGGVITWCKKQKFAHSYVYEVLRGIRHPSPRIMNAVGYRRVIVGEPMKKQRN